MTSTAHIDTLNGTWTVVVVSDFNETRSVPRSFRFCSDALLWAERQNSRLVLSPRAKIAA